MKKTLSFLFFMLLACLAQEAPIVWDFTTGQPSTTDGRFPLTVQGGSHLGPEGLVVSDLENDKPEGATTKRKIHPELSPQAFRLTVQFKLSEKAFTRKEGSFMLYDNKVSIYTGDELPETRHKGIAVLLSRGKNNAFSVKALLGYGKFSEVITSDRFKLVADTSHTLVVDYDGAGSVMFELDGKRNLKRTPNTLPIAPAINPTTIGDRGTSLHKPFEGTIQKVTLEGRPPISVKVQPKGRMAFVRNEANATATLNIWVCEPQKYTGTHILVTGDDGIAAAQKTLKVDADNKAMDLTLPVKTSLRCGDYACTLRIEGNEPPFEQRFTISICPQWYDNDQTRGMSEDKLFYDDIKTVGFTNMNIDCWYVYCTNGLPPEIVIQDI